MLGGVNSIQIGGNACCCSGKLCSHGSPQAAQQKAVQQLNTQDRLDPRKVQAAKDKAFAARKAQYDRQYSEVYAHESAHLAAAGDLASGGIVIDADPIAMVVRGGHVMIRQFFGDNPMDPQQALSYAAQIVSAALAPGNPSGQDQSVAASASARGEAIASQRRLNIQAKKEGAKKRNMNNPFQRMDPTGQNATGRPNPFAIASSNSMVNPNSNPFSQPFSISRPNA